MTPLPKFRISIDFRVFSTTEPNLCGDKGVSVLTPLSFQCLNKLQEKIEDYNAHKLEAVIPKEVEVVIPQILKCHNINLLNFYGCLWKNFSHKSKGCILELGLMPLLQSFYIVEESLKGCYKNE